MMSLKRHSKLLVGTFTFAILISIIETARKSYEQSLNDPNFAGRTRCIVHCMRGRSRSASKLY